jgi:expansin (peptidoglycan-binding protein)
MTWQLAACPDDGSPLFYQFKSGANVWWTALWVRNARLPVAKVEVKSANHADWLALERVSDGSLVDAGGFGEGAFTLRVTAVNGASVSDDFSGFAPGGVVASAQQLR